jgi:hypothetical protein
MSWLSSNKERIETWIVLGLSLGFLYWYWGAQFGKSISFYIQLLLDIFPFLGS